MLKLSKLCKLCSCNFFLGSYQVFLKAQREKLLHVFMPGRKTHHVNIRYIYINSHLSRIFPTENNLVNILSATQLFNQIGYSHVIQNICIYIPLNSSSYR